jgi:hypothetical protein
MPPAAAQSPQWQASRPEKNQREPCGSLGASLPSRGNGHPLGAANDQNIRQMALFFKLKWKGKPFQ